MGKITVETCHIEGLKVITPTVFGDSRGYFMETYNYNDYKAAGIPEVFVQDNQSASKKGVLRGLHFQKEYPQDKLVRVVRGEVFDVAVDLREGSATFGQWYGVLLSEENKKQFFIPKGFAHGFLVLSDFAELLISMNGIIREQIKLFLIADFNIPHTIEKKTINAQTYKVLIADDFIDAEKS